MIRPKIVVHCLVKNEENFIWYALNSVLPFVDKIMVWDNGSTDSTVAIINTIKSPKIEFAERPATSRKDLANLRQEMLRETSSKYDWLMVLDGDEIWPKTSIKTIIRFIATNPKTESIVTWTTNFVGDIYHALPNISGKYRLAGKEGNLAIRFISLKNIPGLHIGLDYGQEGYFDSKNKPIQDRHGIKFLDVSYHHATHLVRSSKNRVVIDRLKKHKYSIGEKIEQTELPSIMFSNHPDIVPNIHRSMTTATIIKCQIFNIFRIIKNLFCG